MLFEQYVIEIIEGRRSSFFIKEILLGFSFVYRFFVELRHKLYDTKWLKSYQAQVPVVSIGNIVAGGVGKTPLVKKLAEELSKKRKLAILTRGFRSIVDKTGGALLWKGEDASLCGDEPFWLGSKLPQVDLWIGKNRVQSAENATLHGAEILLLDDGMQHRRLARDADIVVMDAEDLWGGGYFLPRGLLRDLPSRLKAARLIVLMQVRDQDALERARRAIEKYTKAPLVGMRLEVTADLRGKKVGLFCALGRPHRFLRTVNERGAIVKAEMYGLDHHSFTREELTNFSNKASNLGAELLVCTEKDSVKLPSDLQLSLPITPLPAELKINAGEEHWNYLIKELLHD
ncbi:MAG: tetraacyldisaccharide 4'-kinase [Chlamydiota bacterium]